MTQETAFLDMFPCCRGMAAACGGLEKARVRNVVVSRQKRLYSLPIF